jgi:hypothetical protein
VQSRNDNRRIADGLESPHLDVTVGTGDSDITPKFRSDILPQVVVEVRRDDAVELVRALRTESPGVYVGARNADDGIVTINPLSLSNVGSDYVVERVLENV